MTVTPNWRLRNSPNEYYSRRLIQLILQYVRDMRCNSASMCNRLLLFGFAYFMKGGNTGPAASAGQSPRPIGPGTKELKAHGPIKNMQPY